MQSSNNEPGKTDKSGEERIDVDGILNALEYPLNDQYLIVKEVRKLFIPGLQDTVDLYVAVSKGKTEGEVGFTKKFLLAKCINDLIAGFHLARQGYFPQSFSVLRPILESLDLIGLLNEKPELADLWLEGGHEAWRELKPSKVREKLGLPRDEGYGLFSESGPHATFGSRHGMSAARKNGGKTSIHIWIGGTEFLPNFVFAFGFCFIFQIKIFSMIRKSFPEKITEERFLSIARSLVENFGKFTSTHGKEFAEENGLDISPLIEMQKSLKDALSNPEEFAERVKRIVDQESETKPSG